VTDLHVRVPADLYADLKTVADAEDRSVNWAILQMARVGVGEWKRRRRRHVQTNGPDA